MTELIIKWYSVRLADNFQLISDASLLKKNVQNCTARHHTYCDAGNTRTTVLCNYVFIIKMADPKLFGARYIPFCVRTGTYALTAEL
jgi:hypothetical protein